MFHLLNKIRLFFFSVGWIAQPSLIVLIHVIYSHLCTVCAGDPNLPPQESLKKYYIFAYLQIKIMALFKIIPMDMQLSRV